MFHPSTKDEIFSETMNDEALNKALFWFQFNVFTTARDKFQFRVLSVSFWG